MRLERDEAAQDQRLDAWLDEWPREEMTAVLKLIVQGQAQAAEWQVKSSHAAWLKVQRPARKAAASRRNVCQLRELAQSAASARSKRQGARKR